MTTTILPKINLSNKIDKTTIFEKTDESISINKPLFISISLLFAIIFIG